MSLESVTNISDLIPANPTSLDPKSQGDDHIRNIKKALLNDFAGFTGAVLVTGVDGGTVNAYTLTPATPLVAYGAKMVIAFAPTYANTGACTLKISSLATIPLVSVSGGALVPGDLVVGMIYLAIYDGVSARLTSITKNYVDQATLATVLPAQPGTSIPYPLISRNGVAAFAGSVMPRVARVANTILAAGDSGQHFDVTTAGFTQTFDIPASLQKGFYVLLRNSSSGDLEVEAPTAVATTSATSNSISAGTTWTVALGLSIAAGDLVNIRRTSDPFNQRICSTVTSYDPATGILIAAATLYRIGTGTFTDWTITTRAVTAGIDSRGSYVMYPGECRAFFCDGVALFSVVVSPFCRDFLATGTYPMPPGYRVFKGEGWSGGASGSKSGGGSSDVFGGAGAGAFPFTLQASAVGATLALTIGSGGAGITTSGNSSNGGDTVVGPFVTIKGGAQAGGSPRGGAVLGMVAPIPAPYPAAATGFESVGSNLNAQSSVWGGSNPSVDASTNSGNSVNGGAAGGSVSGSGVIRLPGTSVFGGNGGAAGDATSGAPGSFPGGGGGATRTGATSGAGAAGKVQLWGEA